MLRKLKWQILATRCNWCQGPVPGRGPAAGNHCYTAMQSHIPQQHHQQTHEFLHVGGRRNWHAKSDGKFLSNVPTEKRRNLSLCYWNTMWANDGKCSDDLSECQLLKALFPRRQWRHVPSLACNSKLLSISHPAKKQAWLQGLTAGVWRVGWHGPLWHKFMDVSAMQSWGRQLHIAR